MEAWWVLDALWWFELSLVVRWSLLAVEGQQSNMRAEQFVNDSIQFILIRLEACGWTCVGVPLKSKGKRCLSKLRWAILGIAQILQVLWRSERAVVDGTRALRVRTSKLETFFVMSWHGGSACFRNICVYCRLKWAQDSSGGIPNYQMLSISIFATGGKHCLCTKDHKSMSNRHVFLTSSPGHCSAPLGSLGYLSPWTCSFYQNTSEPTTTGNFRDPPSKPSSCLEPSRLRALDGF